MKSVCVCVCEKWESERRSKKGQKKHDSFFDFIWMHK